MINELSDAMTSAIETIRAYPSDSVTLFHHNDTDGLSSGAILETAFERSGFSVKRFSIEKPYPQLLEIILSRENELIVFTDFAGKIAPQIAEMNKDRNLVIIIDHHPAEKSNNPTVINLDGELYGLKGDRDISASATCYLFALQLNRENTDLSHLGALGAIGDGFFVDGRLSGYNREVMNTAVRKELMEIEAEKTKEKYKIYLDGLHNTSEVCTILDTFGGVGYYHNGSDRGVEICRRGFTQELRREGEALLEKRDIKFREELERLKNGGLITAKKLQWFNVEDRFIPMGVKMIGVFCTQLRNMDFLDKEKYLAGFQTVPDEVPGFGKIGLNATKISMRVSDRLTEKIRKGEKPGLDSFLPEAGKNIGGFADACHSLSAAVTVDIGDEKRLIDEIEKVIEQL